MLSDETWQVPNMWEGGEAWIIGGGPSLIDNFNIPYEVVKKVRFREKGIEAYSPYLAAIHNKHIIGINVAYQFGIWVDICFFGDNKFFLENRNRLSQFRKLVVTSSSKVGALNLDWVKYLSIEKNEKGFQKVGISTNNRQVCWNSNSGAASISLATWLGVKRIVLIGFDMTLSPFNKEQHYHNEYRPVGAKVEEKRLPFRTHLKPWGVIKSEADNMGIEILNTSLKSKIKEIPKVDIKELL